MAGALDDCRLSEGESAAFGQEPPLVAKADALDRGR
jgi:hypothetical protein